MKKFSKVLSSLLAVAMVGTMLAGCGNTTTPAADGSTGTGDSGAAVSADSGAASGETVMLKWIQIGSVPQNNDAVIQAMNDYSIEKIGIGVEISYLDWGVWSDKVTAMINSGEYWDIMFTNGDKYTSGIALGAFADLTDMLGEVPDLQAAIPEKVWEGAKVNGKIYAIPTYKDSSQTQYWVWDKNIIEQYDIPYEELHTLAEMDPYIRQIQDEINAGNITTSRGVGTAIPFALSLIAQLYDQQKADQIRESIVYGHGPAKA